MNVERRLRLILLLVAIVCLGGTIGYKLVGFYEGQDWPLMDCLYMTIITITTVGYGEIVPVGHCVVGQIFTMVLLMVGVGIILYGASTATALLVEGELTNVLWRKKMEKKANGIQNHTIVCGAGSTGIHVIEELVRTARTVVVIEQDEQVAREAEKLGASCVICGDATEDHVLLQAGIERAQGLVASLPEDKDNLVLTLSARQLNPNLRIIARASSLEMKPKLVRAGANIVVSPNQIGGMRMASELVRPEVVSFFDQMLRDNRGNYRMEQVTVRENADFAGKKLSESNIFSRTGLLIVALKRPGEESFIYNPVGTESVPAGSTLVVIGDVDAMHRLRQIAGNA
jgi:voltage-gated potassium channel